MTVTELFEKANLQAFGPVLWGTQVREPSAGVAGVYVVARVDDPNVDCKACDLPPLIDFTNNPYDNLRKPLPPNLRYDPEYERQRWLKSEPVVYIGRTCGTIQKRVGDFYRHECGNRSPHAGGQVVKLLRCPLWVYWSPATDPCCSEGAMICAFKKQVGKEPFANAECCRRRPTRIRRPN